MLFEVFPLNTVSFESDTFVKDPRIAREQSTGIHDVVNDQGFAIHYNKAISNTEVRGSINTAKGWIDFFTYAECFRSNDHSVLNVLEAKIIHCCPKPIQVLLLWPLLRPLRTFPLVFFLFVFVFVFVLFFFPQVLLVLFLLFVIVMSITYFF